LERLSGRRRLDEAKPLNGEVLWTVKTVSISPNRLITLEISLEQEEYLEARSAWESALCITAPTEGFAAILLSLTDRQ
jgi:hypothetical protein